MANIASIQKSEILANAITLSAFEAREAHTVSGESDFEHVLITDQDTDLITTYIDQAVEALTSELRPLIEAVTTGDTISLEASLDSARIDTTAVKRSISESIVAYVMRDWCGQVLPNRVTFYDGLVKEMLAAAHSSLCRKRKPTLA